MLLFLTLVPEQACSRNVHALVPCPSSGIGRFQVRSLALFQERSIRAVPGTFLEELFLEQRLLWLPVLA